MENDNSSPQGIKIGVKTFVTSVLILVGLILVAGVLTRVIPQGVYNRTMDDGRELVVANSFRYVHHAPYPLWHLATAPVEVLFSSDGLMIITIILFIFTIGGSFAILDATGVLKAMISKIAGRFGKHKYRLIPAFVLFFMLLGAVLGIFEEVIPLVPIIVALAYSLGWDSLMGLGLSMLSVAFGFAAAVTNPFSIGVAQRIAGLPMFSGIPFRLLVFTAVYILLVTFLYRHARKIDQDPKASLVYEDDLPKKARLLKQDELFQLTEKHEAAIKFLTGSFLVVLGVMAASSIFQSFSDYALPVIGLLFLLAAVVCGILSGEKTGKVFGIFIHGVQGIAPGAILILLAMSVKYIIYNGGIMDTILFKASNAISSAGSYGAGIMIFLLVLVLNFFIGSASAKAFLVMPLITPLADLVHVTHQTAVLAFCFGDGFSHVIYPTNPVLLIGLGLTVVSYPKWFRWTIKLQAAIVAISLAFVSIAVAVKFGPF